MNLLPTENFITTKEASDLFGYGQSYLARLAREKKIESARIGNTWFVEKESLNRFFKEQEALKEHRSRELAEERAREYQANRLAVQQQQNPVRVLKPRRLTPAPGSIAPASPLSGVLAAAFSALVVGAGVVGAASPVLPETATRVLALAAEASEGFHILAEETFSNIHRHNEEMLQAARETVAAAQGRARGHVGRWSREISPEVLAEPNIRALAMDTNARESVPMTRMSGVVIDLDKDKERVKEFARAIVEFSPKRALAEGYRRVGEGAYEGILATLGGYENALVQSGQITVSFGVALRDVTTALPARTRTTHLALGDGLAAAVRGAGDAGAALRVRSVETVARLVGSIHHLGTVLAYHTARVPSVAVAGWWRAAALPAEFAPRLADGVREAEYLAAMTFVDTVHTIERRYLAGIETAGRLAHLATSEMTYLAGVGRVAVGVEDLIAESKEKIGGQGSSLLAAALPTLTLAERLALSTYERLSDTFDAATTKLAGFFDFSPTVVVVAPEQHDQEEVAVTPPTVPTVPTQAPRAPTTIVSSPTYTTVVEGVTEDRLTLALASLRSELLSVTANLVRPVTTQQVQNIQTIQNITRIEDLTGLIVRNGDLRGGTLRDFYSLSGTNAEFETLTLGSGTLSGNLVVAGSITATSTISSFDSVRAPYFVATSSAATSTFAGSLAIDTDGFVYATSTRNVGIGVLSPAALLAIQNSTSTQPIFVASSAAGAEVYRITNTGFVGIGTTSPTYALSVEGSSTLGNQGIAGYFTATTSTASVFPYASTTAITSSGSAYFATSGGNVGIGSTTPTYKLAVEGISSLGNQALAGYLTATSTFATSTFAGDINFGSGAFVFSTTTGRIGIGTTSPSQLLSVSGNGYFTGGLGIGVATTSAGVLQTSGDARIGGNLTVVGNSTVFGSSTTLGANTTDTLVVNSSIGSNLIPTINATYDVGSPSFYWDDGFFDTITANNISAASTSISGTQSQTFTFNSDNATSDTEDVDLIFYRGVTVPNALITWNSTLDKFDINQPLFLQNDSSTTTVVSLDVWGKSGQTADLFRVASSTGTSFLNVTSTGNVGIGTSTPAVSLDIYSTNALRLPVGTTAQRPSGDVGFIRYNTTNDQFEGYGTDGAWRGLGGVIDIDLDTYITAEESSDEDYLRFYTAASEKLTITNTGNVGIGTTSPMALLNVHNGNFLLSDSDIAHGITDIFGSTAAWLQMSPESATTGGANIMGVSSASGTAGPLRLFGVFGETDPTDTTPGVLVRAAKKSGTSWTSLGNAETVFQVANHGTALATVLGNGNVGIGTTSPAAVLNVYASASNESARFDTNQSNGGYISFYDRTGAATRGYVGFGSTLWSSLASTDFGIRSQGGMAFGDAGAVNMYINSSGNVGIGTTTPDSDTLLTISRSSLTSGISFSNGSAVKGYVGVDVTAGNTITGSAANDMIVRSQSNILFASNGSTERMRITSGGSVGIGGISAPDGTLHVHTATAGSVTANTGADDLVIENSGDAGVTILSPDASRSRIFFGSPTSNAAAQVQWDYTNNTYTVGSARVGASTVLQGGNAVTNLTLSGASGSELATFAGDVTLSSATPRLQLTATTGTNAAYQTFTNTGGNFYVGIDNSAGTDFASAYAGAVWHGGAYPLLFGTSNAERMRITSAGNVGIGTTSPLAKLHVYGTSGSSGAITPNTSYDTAYLEDGSATGITLGSTDAGTSGIAFASPSDNYGAFIEHSYNSNYLSVGTGKVGSSLRLYGDNSVLNLTLSGASGSELAAFAGNVNLLDGKMLRLGTSNDFNIYHDGSHSYATNNTGDLYLGSESGVMYVQGSNVVLRGDSGTSYTSFVDADQTSIDFGNTTNNQQFNFLGTGNSIFGGGGKVGIGTTSPRALLTVGSTTPNAIASANLYNSAHISGDLEVDGNIYGTLSASNIPLTQGYTFVGDSSNQATATSSLFIASSGNVGIGTVSPSSLLHLSRNSSSGLEMLRVTSSVNGVDDVAVGVRTGDGNHQIGFFGVNAYIDNGGAVADTGTKINSGHSAWVIGGKASNEAFESQSLFAINYLNAAGTATTSRLVIDSNGDVGIGQTAPYGKFVVNMGRTTSATTVDEVGDYIDSVVLEASGASNTGDKMPLVFNLGSSGSHNISSVIEAGREASGWNTYLAFYTNNVTSGAQGTDAIQEKMRITSDGNLGVGIAAPDGRLHVHTATAGSVTAPTTADDLVVENSGNGGISVLVPDGSYGTVSIGSPTLNAGANWIWQYNENTSYLSTYRVGANIKLRADNAVENLTLSGASGSQVAAFAGRVTIAGTGDGTWPLSITTTSGGATERYIGRSSDDISQLRFFANNGTTALANIAANTTSMTLGTFRVGSSLVLHGDNEITNLTLSGASGSERAAFVGSVGIASSTPWGKLSVTNTGSGPSFVVEDSTSPDSTPFMVDASGRVLVGASSAETNGLLQVNGNIGLAPNSTIRQWTNADSGGLTLLATQVVVGASNSHSYGYSGGALLASVSNSDGGMLLDAGYGGSGHRLRVTNSTGGNGTLTYANSGGTVFSVDSSTGATAITSSATTGNAISATASSLTTGSAGYFYSNSADTSTRSLVNIINDNTASSGTTAFRVQQDSTGDIVNFFDGATEVFTILDGGNVGIGTSSPYTKLAVSGTGNVHSLVESTSGGGANFILRSVASHAESIIDRGSTSNYGVQVFRTAGTNDWLVGQQIVPGANSDYSWFSYGGPGTVMTIKYATGNIGIGTTSPQGKLDVWDGNTYFSDTDVAHGMTALAPTNAFGKIVPLSGTAGGLHVAGYSDTDATPLYLSGTIGSTNPTDTVPAIMFSAAKSDGSTGNNVLAAAETAFGFDYDGDAIAEHVILGNGNFGIGTTTPGSLLTVQAAASGTALNIGNGSTLVTRGTLGNSTATVGIVYDEAAFELYRPNSGTERVMGMRIGGYSGVDIRNQFYYGGESLRFGYVTANANSSMTDVLTLTTSGDVGIGDTTPSAKLDVAGSIYSSGDIQVNSGSVQSRYFRIYESSASRGGFYPYNLAAGSGTDYSVGLFSETSLYFAIAGGAAKRMVIDTSGNVGIGTTSPYAKLSVEGAGTGTGVNFQTTNSSATPLFTILDNGNVGLGANAPAVLLDLGVSSDLSGVDQVFGLRTNGNSRFGMGLSGQTMITYIPHDLNAGEGMAWGSMTGASNTFSEKARLTVGGNFGIGTTGPAALLSVAGAGYFTGNVGIGVASASQQLEIRANDADSVGIRFNNTSTNGENWRLSSNGASASAGAGAFSFYNVTDDAYRLVLSASGNVGIGTTTPTAKLHISTGTPGITTPLSSADELAIEGSGDAGLSILTPTANQARIAHGTPLDTDSAVIVMDGTSRYMAFETASAERVRITSTGLLGVGTTTPGAKLVVSGTGIFGSTAYGALSNGVLEAHITSAGTTAASQDALSIVNRQAVGADVNAELTFRGTSGGNVMGIIRSAWAGSATSNGSYLSFYTRNTSDTGVEVMRLNQSGNVGIGTTSPYAKLSLQNTLGGTTPLFIVASSTSGAATSTALFVDAYGNVGVGTTTSPSQRLYVDGNLYVSNGASTAATIFVGGSHNSDTTPAELFLSETFDPGNPGATYGVKLRYSGGSNRFDILGDFAGTDTVRLSMLRDSGNLGLGTTSPYAKLAVEQTLGGTDALFVVASSTSGAATSTAFLIDAYGKVGVGTTTPLGKLTVTTADSSTDALVLSRTDQAQMWGINLSANDFNIIDRTVGSTPQFTIMNSSGYVGVGSSTPWLPLAVQNTSSSGQFVAAYDTSNYATLTVDATGDLKFLTKGGDIRALSDNLWVCDNAGCPSLTATSTAGNIFVENAVTFGNGFSLASTTNAAASELGLYNASGNLILIFDDEP